MKSFDVVVGRLNMGTWYIDFFDYYDNSSNHPYHCLNNVFDECLPHNEETEKLIGTTNDYAQ